jgi:YHS domain-containing protein
MMPRLIIVAIVVYFLYKLIKGWKSVSGVPKTNLPDVGEDLVEDPVCHTYVPVSHACRISIDGKTVSFCSKKCLEKYKEKKRT